MVAAAGRRGGSHVDGLRFRVSRHGGRPGPIPCKQQGIYRALLRTGSHAGTRSGGSPTETDRPRRPRGTLLSCDVMARDISLACKRPALRAPGAIPTVEFLLSDFPTAIKKVAVKSHVWRAAQFLHRHARPSVSCRRRACSIASVTPDPFPAADRRLSRIDPGQAFGRTILRRRVLRTTAGAVIVSTGPAFPFRQFLGTAPWISSSLARPP